MVLSKKHLLSNYNEMAESYAKRHKAVKARMEKRRIESTNLKKTFEEKTEFLNRIRNK